MKKFNAAITGLASYVPDYILNNQELSQMVDTSDEWIMTRVGIKERHILKGEGLGSSYMGIQAVNQLLEKTGTRPEEIDLVICATSNPDYRFPSTASIIIEATGITNAAGYDIQAACTGFLVALEAGAAYVTAGLYKKVIVLSTEKMSSMVNYKDRTTCPLFGDAAAAMLLEPNKEGESYGVADGYFRTNGVGTTKLIMKAGGSAYPATHETVDAGEHFLYQDGRVVFKHAVEDMSDATGKVMERNNLTAENVAWFIPHQANMRIIEAVADRVNVPHDKILVNIQDYGNTSAASIPLCMSLNEAKFKKGDNLVLAAFGAGFTWGALYLKWGYDAK